jgi:hypothetical protein
VGERKELKAERERAAIEEIRTRVAGDTGQEIFELWHEFEAHTTAEARFATALDNLEVQIQHNLADFGTWEPIEYDLVYTKMDARCLPDRALQRRKGASRGQDGWRRSRRGLDQSKGCREIKPGSGAHLLTGTGAKELAPHHGNRLNNSLNNPCTHAPIAAASFECARPADS